MYTLDIPDIGMRLEPTADFTERLRNLDAETIRLMAAAAADEATPANSSPTL